MKPYLTRLFLLFLSSWLVIVAVSLQPAAAQGDVFGARVAGSFLVQLELTGAGPAPFSIQALATLGADGSAIATDTDDYGFGTGTFFHSPKHGVWKKTGRRAISITLLEFAYDTEGALTTIYRLVFDGQFGDRNLNTGEGVVTFDAFGPDQDPLDPDEVPLASGEGSFSVRRIEG